MFQLVLFLFYGIAMRIYSYIYEHFYLHFCLHFCIDQLVVVHWSIKSFYILFCFSMILISKIENFNKKREKGGNIQKVISIIDLQWYLEANKLKKWGKTSVYKKNRVFNQFYCKKFQRNIFNLDEYVQCTCLHKYTVNYTILILTQVSFEMFFGWFDISTDCLWHTS